MSRIAAILTILTIALPTLSIPTAGTTYSISPKSFPDLCLAPAADSEGSRLVVKSCDDADSDIAWVYDGLSLTNSATNMCVDVADGGDWSGNAAQVWNCYSRNRNQMFTMNGEMIKWSGKNQCLDLTDGKGSDGNKVQIWSCGSSNPNQQWKFNEVEEVDGCDATTNSTASGVNAGSATTTTNSTSSGLDSGSATTTANSTSGDDIGNDDGDLDDCDDSDESSTATLASPTKASSASLTTAVTASATYIASTANATANSTIGGDLWAGGASSESTSGHSHHHHSGSSSSTDGSGASYTDASNSTTYATASSTAWGETSSETASATASITNNATSTSTSTTSSGYLQVSGTSVVDSSGKTVVLRGTNLGGWLVMEDWMCGISDESGSADRFSQTTLENRFGVDKTHALLNTWQDNWLVSSDFDNMAALGFNVVRLPFGFRNLQWANGSWITDSSGNVDFSRLDWAVALAKSRGIYVIPVFHIWQGQEQGYSTISEDSDEGKTQRAAAAAIWVKVATHFVGESGIAAFDAINEATGSANDNLQKALYKAIRSVDANRIIIMESIGTNPSNYGWTNVMYSLHEYLMMGSDVGYNKQQWNGGAENDINQWLGYGIPVYIGEFMADGSTLSWMLSTMNSANLWWSGWTYKTVNMGRWGLYNTGNIYVDVSSDSYSSINSAWSNLGEITKQAVASEYKSATSQRRSLAVGSPRAAQTKRFTGPHKGRSRRGLVHGGSNRF